jgi:hypothetical protein
MWIHTIGWNLSNSAEWFFLGMEMKRNRRNQSSKHTWTTIWYCCQVYVSEYAYCPTRWRRGTQLSLLSWYASSVHEDMDMYASGSSEPSPSWGFPKVGYHSACLNPSKNVALSNRATILREMLCTVHETCSFESATFKINQCSACITCCQISAKTELKHECRNVKIHDWSSYGHSFEEKQCSCHGKLLILYFQVLTM